MVLKSVQVKVNPLFSFKDGAGRLPWTVSFKSRFRDKMLKSSLMYEGTDLYSQLKFEDRVDLVGCVGDQSQTSMNSPEVATITMELLR